MKPHTTTVKVTRARWAVLQDSLPVGAIGNVSHPRGRGAHPIVWVVLDAGRGVDITAVRDITYIDHPGAVQALLDIREAHERAQRVEGLTHHDRRILDFEAAYWRVPATVRLHQAGKVFGLDRDTYLDTLRRLVDVPACREYSPDVVNRIVKLLDREPRHRAVRPA